MKNNNKNKKDYCNMQDLTCLFVHQIKSTKLLSKKEPSLQLQAKVFVKTKHLLQFLIK